MAPSDYGVVFTCATMNAEAETDPVTEIIDWIADANSKEICLAINQVDGSAKFYFVYCNLGGYSVKKARLIFYNAEGDEFTRVHFNDPLSLSRAYIYYGNLKTALKNSGTANQNYVKVNLSFLFRGETPNGVPQPLLRTMLSVGSRGVKAQP